MFTSQRPLNAFLRSSIHTLMKDIPAERINERAPGNGHPPLWILGHLAICAEFGEALLGKEMEHPEWVAVFGPGSSDEVQNPESYSLKEIMDVIDQGYPRLMDLLDETSADALNANHEVELLKGSELVSVGDLQTHLLTSHIAFHAAQLSGWRRAAGFGPLF